MPVFPIFVNNFYKFKNIKDIIGENKIHVALNTKLDIKDFFKYTAKNVAKLKYYKICMHYCNNIKYLF